MFLKPSLKPVWYIGSLCFLLSKNILPWREFVGGCGFPGTLKKASREGPGVAQAPLAPAGSALSAQTTGYK